MLKTRVPTEHAFVPQHIPGMLARGQNGGSAPLLIRCSRVGKRLEDRRVIRALLEDKVQRIRLGRIESIPAITSATQKQRKEVTKMDGDGPRWELRGFALEV